MKLMLIIGFALFFSVNSFAQTKHYKIIDLGSRYTSEQIDAALKEATMCNYIYRSKESILVFDDGTKVSMNPALTYEVFPEGCFVEDNIKMKDAEWRIDNNGHLNVHLTTNSK